MEAITIKRLTLNDLSRLQQIAGQTFSETFSEVNTAENMNKYLEEKFSPEQLSSELNDKDSQFYFAELNNNILGYLKLNSGPSQTELKDNRALEIERIYVLKEFHGRKVGQLLFNKAIEIAIQTGVEYVWLGVWEENQRALNFYKKNGFIEFDRHIFKLGDSRQTDLLMKRKLLKSESALDEC